MSDRLVLSATTLTNNTVKNPSGEELGRIVELMIDVPDGTVAYAVLQYKKFMGLGEKVFAIPYRALRLDMENNCWTLDIKKERLQGAPGFDRNEWPDMADPQWASEIFDYYQGL